MFRRAAIFVAIVVSLGCGSGGGAPVADASVTDSPASDVVVLNDVASNDAGDGGLAAGAVCNPFPPFSPCASGLVCMPVLTLSGDAVTAASFECVYDPTPLVMGSPCTSTHLTSTPPRIASACGPELVCVFTGTNTMGTCAPLCTAAVGFVCNTSEVCETVAAVAGIGACGPLPATCDPVAQTGCASGTACYLEYDLVATVAACLMPTDPSTAVPENGACSNGGCAAGFTCYPDGGDAGVGAGHCRRFCAPGASTNACATATPTCTAVTVTGAAGAVGVCLGM